MKRFIVLVLALAIATPALAEDLSPASFRGLLGSTFSDWTYDDPCGVYSFDPPESSWFVSHPDMLDPEGIDPCNPGFFSAQTWGGDNDPCTSDWYDALPGGRQGGIDFAYGSWEMNNFIDGYTGNGVIKEIWIQITYSNGTAVPSDFAFGAGYIGDPCEEGEFVGVDLVNSQVLDDGWLHDVFHVDIPVVPDYEWIEGGGGGNVLIDQVIIETWIWVPEPATMVLFGLGGLIMIRRRR